MCALLVCVCIGGGGIIHVSGCINVSMYMYM